MMCVVKRAVRAIRSGRTGHKALGAAAVAITITVFSFASTLVKLADTPAVLVAFWRMVITAIVWNAIAFDHRAWLALHRDADVDDRRARRAAGIRTAEPTRGLQTGPLAEPVSATEDFTTTTT